MATLQAIGFTVAGGSVVFSTCLLFFGIAVHKQSPFIAPRASARPAQVIYNPSAGTGHVQHRGSAFLGWISWCRKLSYETLLRGVPGTGTRKGGMDGTLLHVTLDGIVLLRFHVVGRKIAAVATALCCGLLLPLYITAPCILLQESSSEAVAATNSLSSSSDAKYMPAYDCNATLTTFRQTTLSHVPDLLLDDSTRDRSYYYQHEQWLISLRLYVVVLVLWLITLYVFILLRQEWIELLALRRIHYLESTRGGEKQASQEWRSRLLSAASLSDSSRSTPKKQAPPIPQVILPQHTPTLIPPLIDSPPKSSSPSNAAPIRRLSATLRHHIRANCHCEDADNENEPHLMQRQPWIPHPEQPDTVPNVEPYSILVGHLPLPVQESKIIRKSDVIVRNSSTSSSSNDFSFDEESSDKTSDDWSLISKQCDYHALSILEIWQYQLSFLQHLIESSLPPEPGYSSPIAVMTIVPPSDAIGKCWRKWYTAASALRRLEFLQSLLPKTPRNNSANHNHNIDNNPINGTARMSTNASPSHAEAPTLPASPPPLTSPSPSPPPFSPSDLPSSVKICTSPTSPVRVRTRLSQRHQTPPTTNSYLLQVFGGHYNPSMTDDIRAVDTSAFGPEQMAVFSREFAQSASNCCPYGMWEGYLRARSVAELEKIVVAAEWWLHQAVQELQDERSSMSTRLTYIPVPPPPVNRLMYSTFFESFTRLPSPSLLLRLRRRRGSAQATNGNLQNDKISAVEMAGLVREGSENRGDDLESSLHSNDTTNGFHRNRECAGNWLTHIASATSTFPIIRDMRDRKCWKQLMESTMRNSCTSTDWSGLKEMSCSSLKSVLLQENSYAVLTFTSRQAAAAARQCISAHNNVTLHNIPIPPLADAAPCTAFPCRFICRPVSVAAKDWQKNVRLYIILSWLGLMYTFYTIPLSWSTSQIDPDTIAWMFPDHSIIAESFGVNIPELISGLASSIIWSFFFMMCPQVFKMVAYFGSQSASLAQAERRAMQYFWWFMVLTAFSGPMLAYWIIGAVNKSQKLGVGLRDVLIRIAGATPTLLSWNWMNWVIYRTTIILPINFLLQFNTFLFSFLGLNCFSRLTIGGGPGGPVPYRIFVDSGVVLMCTFALAPSSPLVAPAALAYFCFCEPLLKRNLIFVYRPRYDDGGLRWIFVFDMIISALVVGQILLALEMALKNAFGPASIAALAIPGTIWFQWYCKRKFDPAFENTALLRTSLIDGWESLDEMSLDHREAHLSFLVDAHKAAYVPVCIAGTDAASQITAEPAVAVPHSIIDSDSEHSDPPLKLRSPYHNAINETKSHAISGDDMNKSLEAIGKSDEGIGWLESALEPDELEGAFGIFRLTSHKLE